MRVAVVISTRNRPQHVAGLLTSLRDQRLVPTYVVVVDSSDSRLVLTGAHTFEVITRRCLVKSLPTQRNLGVDLVLERHDTDAICFLDDDVRPAPDYLEKLASILERDTVRVVGGVSGTSGWARTPLSRRWRVFNRVFCLWSPKDGVVLRSGINLPIPGDRMGVSRSAWLFGCSMWRVEVFHRYRFNDNLPGSALFEDVEFSMRVGREQVLLVDSSARLDHLLEADQRPNMRLQYERHIRNRAEVVRASGGGLTRWSAFWWSVVGESIQVGRHALPGSSDYRQRFAGLVSGTSRVLSRGAPR